MALQFLSDEFRLGDRQADDKAATAHIEVREDDLRQWLSRT